MKIIKWIVAAVVLGWLGSFGASVIADVSSAYAERKAAANSYGFDRPIASVPEFQAATYLRNVMAKNHCQALGFDLNEERFYTAAAAIGFTRAQLLETSNLKNSDTEYFFNTIERALPRNPNSGDIPCGAMFTRLVAAVPGSVVKTR
jgi:hypothetical protein